MSGPRPIQPKAFAILLNPGSSAHLVSLGEDATKSPSSYHRLLGGHVEFGEPSEQAVIHEIVEETGCVLRDPALLGVLENRFVYENAPGHEIVFVYTGRHDLATVVPDEGAWMSDNDEPMWVTWRPVAAGTELPPLYPDGAQALIDRLVEGGQ